MQVVVDLFAGIGYFTVPLLALPPRCKKLFACEINPNSVFALQQNLLRNGVVRLSGGVALMKLPSQRHRVVRADWLWLWLSRCLLLGGSLHSARRGQRRFWCVGAGICLVAEPDSETTTFFPHLTFWGLAWFVCARCLVVARYRRPRAVRIDSIERG